VFLVFGEDIWEVLGGLRARCRREAVVRGPRLEGRHPPTAGLVGARPVHGAARHGTDRGAVRLGAGARCGARKEERRSTARWLGDPVRQPRPTRHFAEHMAGGVSACWLRQGRTGSRLGCKREGELEREQRQTCPGGELGWLEKKAQQNGDFLYL
jgi:hypothetical protein